MQWAERARQLQEHRGAVLFTAPLHYGVGYLVQALGTPEKPLVWTELTPSDEADVTSQGNKLAEAVNRSFDAKLLSYGLPFAYNLNVLKTLHSVISPCTLALTEAQYAPEFAKGLLELASQGCQVILQFDALPETFSQPKDALVISKDEIKLSLEVALEVVQKRISKKQVQTLLAKTNHAYDHFLAELHQELKLPPHLVPGPTGPRMLPGYELDVEPATLLKVLEKRRRWLEALELAVHNLPERVPKVLEEAGHAYHEQGLHKRLFALLENLPEEMKAQENVLYWRLQAAFRLGREQELRKETVAFLKMHEAPELRALYAGVFAPTNRKEALRAYRAKKTPFTVFQFGYLSTAKKSVALLEESTELAKNYGQPYEVIRNAGELANKLMLHGAYTEALEWHEWSLKEFARLGIKDGQRYLLILNNWAYNKMLTGNLAGLEMVLKTHEQHLGQAYPYLAYLFSETVGDYFLATSRPGEALVYYEKNARVIPQHLLSLNTLNRVRALLGLDKAKEALALARSTLELTKQQTLSERAEANLAYGMALTASEPSLAKCYLQTAQKSFKQLYHAPRLAQTALYLALSESQQGQLKEARNILVDPKHHVRDLSAEGLRLLSGSEGTFQPLWQLLKGHHHPLELRFLGYQDVWFEGEKIKLQPQQLEILTVLAIQNKPVTLEELLSNLYGDGGSRQTLKSVLSRLRHILPVISAHPYRLTVKCRADFTDMLARLKEGNVKAALELYHGPLLKFSDAPFIRQHNDLLGESLRGATLTTQDPQLLLQLSDYMADDLELLEHAQQRLEQSDPRKLLLQARVRQIQNNWLN